MASGKRLLAGSSEREQALLQARESYRALVEQVPAILYTEVILEGEELPLYVSPHLKEVLGVSQQEFMRRETWGAMLHPEDRDRVVRENEEWLCGGPDVGDYRIVRPDGDVVWIRDRATMTRDEVSGLRFVRGIFVDVTELKRAEEIITHQVERLRKVDRIGRDFTGLVLGGASLQQILEGLSTIVGDPVVLEDSSHNLVGAAGRTEAVDSVIDDWQAHSRIDHEALEPGLARVEGEHPCTWIAISLRGEPWGRMHMIEAGRSIDEVDALALDRAAAAVSLSLLSKRDADGPAEAAGGALVADILQGRYASSTEILRRARAVGANLDGRTLACLAIILPLTRGILGEPAVGDPRGGELPPEVLRTVRDVVRAARCTALMALDGARILIVVRVSEEQEAREVLTGLGEAVLGRIDGGLGRHVTARLGECPRGGRVRRSGRKRQLLRRSWRPPPPQALVRGPGARALRRVDDEAAARSRRQDVFPSCSHTACLCGSRGQQVRDRPVSSHRPADPLSPARTHRTAAGQEPRRCRREPGTCDLAARAGPASKPVRRRPPVSR